MPNPGQTARKQKTSVHSGGFVLLHFGLTVSTTQGCDDKATVCNWQVEFDVFLSVSFIFTQSCVCAIGALTTSQFQHLCTIVHKLHNITYAVCCWMRCTEFNMRCCCDVSQNLPNCTSHIMNHGCQTPLCGWCCAGNLVAILQAQTILAGQKFWMGGCALCLATLSPSACTSDYRIGPFGALCAQCKFPAGMQWVLPSQATLRDCWKAQRDHPFGRGQSTIYPQT